MSYSRRLGEYVEMCAGSEREAVRRAFCSDITDGVAIELAQDDIRHTHNGDGSCIPVHVPFKSRSGSDCRLRMGRAFTAGYEMHFD